ncbi:hypothetical protein [Asanoa siamensis]|uniref:ABC-2 type transport system permease protein n=1 Tax=Asanoa siamensis TaxID=926357 RepID=A0ABQ4CVU7_9ACTN|nr:hypothetical protein [Asanoa siamensis]GIF75409.1 hypothetical protein Asi02nite_49270 [Asanoa siamensis]
MLGFLLLLVVLVPAPLLALILLILRIREAGAANPTKRIRAALRGGTARPVWPWLLAAALVAAAGTAGIEQAYLVAVADRPSRDFDLSLLAVVSGQLAVVGCAAMTGLVGASVARARGFGAGTVAGLLTLVAVAAGTSAAHLPLKAAYLADPTTFPLVANLGQGDLLMPFDAFRYALVWALPWPVIGAALAARRRVAVRDLPQLLLDLATADLPAGRAAWGAALRAELAAIDPPAERRRFARGGAWAALRSGAPRYVWLLALGVSAVVAAGTFAASRWELAHDRGGVLDFWLSGPSVLLLAAALVTARHSRSLGAGIRAGVGSGLGALLAVVAVGIPEAVVWADRRAGFLSTGDAVPPSVEAAIRDVVRPEFLLSVVVVWTAAVGGGAVIGAALSRLRARTL